MSKVDTLNIVKNFLKNQDKFKLVYNTDIQHQSNSYGLITPITQNLLVLDSSFNPPHLGHLSMIERSQSIINKNNATSNNLNLSCINIYSVLLLLSVKNADKNEVSSNEYSKRLKMMILLANYIKEINGINCGVALTNASLFVDKSDLITDWIHNETKEHNINITNNISNYFLLGFDTIIRFFDPKYYINKSIIESLNPFFQNSKIVVLLRDDKSSKMDITKQKEYLNDIVSKNQLNDTTLPDSWKGKLLYGESQKEWNISSSGIRKEISNNISNDWESKVIPSIKDFIKNNSMYQN